MAKKENGTSHQYIESEDGHLLVIGYIGIYSINYLDGSIERWATPESLKEKIIYMTEQKQPYIVQHNEDYTEKTYYYVDLHTGELLGEYKEKGKEEKQEEDFLTDQIEQQLKDKYVSYYSRRKDANSGFDYVMKGVLGIYGYQEENGEVTEIMNYLNSDKAFEGYWGFSNIRFIDRDHFVAVQRNNVTSEKMTQIFYCSRVSPDKVPDREKVVLATDNQAENVWNKIVAFNQSNDTYRISVEIYDWSFDDDRNSTACLEEMEKRGIKNAELAEQTGISAATISNYRNGNRKPRGFEETVPISKALNVSLDYLAGVVDYNYLEESGKSGSSLPQNYYDAVKMLGMLALTFAENSDLSAITADLVRLDIRDHALAEFVRQQQELFDMLGRSLSERAFTIAIDDLNEKMKENPIPIPEDLPFK